MSNNQLHANQPVLHTGAPIEQAKSAMIMIHGRGASADDIIGLAAEFERPDIAYLAPQAANNTWYPQRFMAPLSSNEPWLSSALERIDTLLAYLAEAGIPAKKTVLLGFSQGACLVLEYAARNAKRYAGVVALSGGLIGPDGTPRNDTGSLEQTPVLLGCSDVDFHIPVQRVHESANIMQQLGAAVDKRIYPGMGHTINQDEVQAVKLLLKAEG